MASINVLVSKYVVLSIQEEEAKWLKGYMQNPLIPDESELDSKMRETFWNALTKAGVELP